MTKVKICGITNSDDANAAVKAGADMIGMVLCESPRQVDYLLIPEIISVLSPENASVGVFAAPDDLLRFSKNSDLVLDYYQTYFDYSRLEVRRPKSGWIRAIWINQKKQIQECEADKFLLDFRNVDNGIMEAMLAGLGKSLSEKIILAGRLTVESVARLVKKYHPWGVDVARGTEISPGIKDHNLVNEFIERVRHAPAE